MAVHFPSTSRIMDSKELLNTISSNQYNYPWFVSNETYVYHVIKRGLSDNPNGCGDYLDSLFLLTEFILTHLHKQDWETVIRQAAQYSTNQAQQQNTGLRWWRKLRGMYALGRLYTRLGRYAQAEQVLGEMLVLAEDQRDFYLHVQALTGLLYIQAHYTLTPSVVEMVRESILLVHHKTNRIVSRPEVAAFNQAMAAADNATGDYQVAAQEGLIAYQFWKARDNLLEMGRTAIALHTSHSYLSAAGAGDWWLEQARLIHQQIDNDRLGAAVEYALACDALRALNYHESAVYMERAAKLYLALGDVLGQAQAYHSAAMALVYADELDRAEQLLFEARQLFDQLGNRVQAGHVNHTWSFLDAKRGDKQRAVARLDAALQVLDEQQISNNQLIHRTLGMDRLRRAIEDGTSLSDIEPYKS